MVFSFFKKPPQKMPERPAARPKPLTPPSPEPSDAVAGQGEPPAAAEAAEQERKPDLPPLDFTDSQFGFTDSGITGIEVENDFDPVQADIEQAAVLFANSQDSAARAVLEASARAHSGAQAERLWRMLLDLMQVLGDRAAFETLGEEFARTCETSPPTWRSPDTAAPAGGASAGEKRIILQGVIAGADAPEIVQFREAVGARLPLLLDLGKLASCDEAAATELLDLLRQTRKQAVALALEGTEGLVGRLEKRLVVGQQEAANTWLLLLELYQRLGNQEAFEEKAVDYAVTFEVSPPSWEVLKAQPKPVARPAAAADDAHHLTGELKNCRFEDVQAYVESCPRPVLDFSRVKRMDFFSAGLLRNILDRCPREGKEVVIRNPHHLVAELMGIVDLPSVAKIIVRNY